MWLTKKCLVVKTLTLPYIDEVKCTALQNNTLYYVALHLTALYSTALYSTKMYSTALYSAVMYKYISYCNALLFEN